MTEVGRFYFCNLLPYLIFTLLLCFSLHPVDKTKLPCIIVLLLLYLSVGTRAVIGQFCGPYFTVRPANFENFFFRAPD